jgi:uncharacterized protein (DUF2235 family)
MKKGLSHIFQKAIITVLMTGFLAHLMLPLSSHAQKTAFTRWLDHNVVATGDENEAKLRNTIRQLSEQSNDFLILVQEASQLVANHKNEFRLNTSLPENSESQVSTWLIGQWNVFQHQKTGMNAVLSDAAQPFQKWISSQNFLKYHSSPAVKHIQFLSNSFEVLIESSAIREAIVPLISGISINAP